MAIRSAKRINHVVFKYYSDKLNASKYSAVIQGSVATAQARQAEVHKLAIHQQFETIYSLVWRT